LFFVNEMELVYARMAGLLELVLQPYAYTDFDRRYFGLQDCNSPACSRRYRRRISGLFAGLLWGMETVLWALSIRFGTPGK
jgi:hypothetical protein